LEQSTTYRDGKWDGLREEFHEDGQLRGRENWIDGKIEGLSEFYRNGQVWWRRNYRDGKEDGLFEAFDEAGNLTRTETWENGEQIEKTKPLN